VERRFHLHRLDRHQHVAGLDSWPAATATVEITPGIGAADMGVVAGFRLAHAAAEPEAPCARSGTLMVRLAGR
jgi:hypothetical protein